MSKTNKKRIIIIGGGPAGLAGAIAAAQAARAAGLEEKTEIILLEKQDRVGRKLLATGNGRCNLANSTLGLQHYHSMSLKELGQIPEVFNLAKTTGFFRDLGVLLYEEEGRLYPYSQQASAVLDVLRWKTEELGVRILCGHCVVGIDLQMERFVLKLDNGQHLTAERAIVACGGLAAPQMGGSGDGYRLLCSCGHTLEPTFPALVPLRVASADMRVLKGIRVSALVELLTPAGEYLGQERGEVLFTDYGVSGIVIMQLSRQVSCLEHNTKHKHNSKHKASTEGESAKKINLARLRLDLLESWQEAPLAKWLRERADKAPLRPLEDFLVGIVPKRVGQVLLRQLDLDRRREANSLKETELHDMAHILKNWCLPVSAAGSWQQAQTTAGGIRLSEFASQTLESLFVPGLYAIGEVLDVDGNCGGYNLQWAWTSGCLAGQAAALSLREDINMDKNIGMDTVIGGGFLG